MAHPTRSTIGAVLAAALALAGACAPRTPPDADASADSGRVESGAPEHAVSIRFAIEVEAGVQQPVYVLLHEEDSQVGWVQVTRDGTRVYLAERCEIPDCGETPAVCGAALPMLRDLAADAGPGAAELAWDGTTSALYEPAGCEARVPAGPGAYVARLCYAREAEFDTGTDPERITSGGVVPGRLVGPTCVDRPFKLGDGEVLLVVGP